MKTSMNKQITRAFLAIAIALTAVSCSNDSSPAEEQLHGYMIANYTINDRETFSRYMEAAGSLAPRYNGKVIIYNESPTTLEGNPKAVIAVAEFPSVEQAERFYNSPEYTAARQFRIASTEGTVLLAEGSASWAFADTATQAYGYMIANYTINDQTTFQQYMNAAGPLAPRYNGRVIIYDTNPKVLEGQPKLVIAVAEFPGVAETERFYNSPEYTAARPFRIASTEGSVLLTGSIPAQN